VVCYFHAPPRPEEDYDMKILISARKPVLWTTFILITVLTAWACQPNAERDGPPLKLSLGLAPFPYSGLVAIADAKGFFKESGLDLTIKDYSFGFATLEALSKDEIQMAMGNEFSFAMKINEDPSLRLVASVALVNTNEIVARVDRQIHEPSDLKGKRIGICPNTSSEYFFLAFLLLNKIALSDVTMVNVPATDMVDVLIKGEIDAVSGWDTISYDAKKRLAENAVVWPAQNNRDWHWVLAVKDTMTRSPEPIKRFLLALLKAEDYALANKDDAKDIITRRWNFKPEFIQLIWDKTRLNVTLTQSLIVSLESFSKWYRLKEGKQGVAPNFLNYVYTAPLAEINPKAVTIFE
jgi:ABC-type nitrate/sulfonate/bicarbonate transport system substrate-binding protein